MRTKRLGLAVTVTATLFLAPAATPAAPCGFGWCPPPPCSLPSTDPMCYTRRGADVLVVNRSFTPSDATVSLGTQIVFQNLDGIDHTVTDDRCTDENDATPCGFDLSLRPGDNLEHAKSISVGGTYIIRGHTYTYHCQIHPTMTGRFTTEP